MSTDQTTDPFFIIGTGRCGTTLLQRMLMGHPHIDIPPETHFFSRFDPLRIVNADPVPEDMTTSYIERCAGHPWFKALEIEKRPEIRAELERNLRHNSDERRAFQIAALAVAADAERYASVAKAVGMSEAEVRKRDQPRLMV